MKLYPCFASTNRGLEPLLIEELSGLGATAVIAVNAGVQFNANMQTVMRLNLHSRLASRILIEIGKGNYRNENDIYELAHKINWHEWFTKDATLKVSTSAINSPVKSLEFITLKVKDAVCDYFTHRDKQRPDIDKRDPDMRIHAFLTRNKVNLYLDTSGEALFKRGYRSSHQEAPLKENLAAGLVKLSGWDYATPLIDPMCGSGTIIVEALLQALNIAPGLNRKFAFEKFANFYQKDWDDLKFQAKAQIKNDIRLQIFASDINPAAIKQTETNLKHARLREYVEFKTADFLSLTPPPNSSGTILCNPPYGVRLSELDRLAELYPKIGTHLKQNYAGWDCWFFSADLRLPKLMHLKPTRKTPLFNGALDCRLFEFKMVSGSNR